MKFSITPLVKVPPTIFILVDEYSPIAKKIAYQYIYDPEHKNKPSGDWKQTDSGWSDNTDAQITFSPVVNAIDVPGLSPEENEKRKKELTNENRVNRMEYVRQAIANVLGTPKPFSISEKNRGRYLADSGRVYKEESYSFDINDISQDEAERIAREIANKMRQESVLVFNKDSGKAKIVYIKEKSDNDFELGPKSNQFIIDSQMSSQDTASKIDSAVKKAMKGKMTGWTILKAKESVVKVHGKEYLTKSNPVVFHGLEQDDIDNIGKELVSSFRSGVLSIDMKTKIQKVF